MSEPNTRQRGLPRKLNDSELGYVTGGDQPNQNAGGGPGNSGPGDKDSPVEGPPPGQQPSPPGQ